MNQHYHPEREGIHESHAYMLHGKIVTVSILAPDPAAGATTAIVTATVKNALDNKPLVDAETPLVLSAFSDADLLTLDAGLTWQNETKGTLVSQAGGVAQVITDKNGQFECELDFGAGPAARTAYVVAEGRVGSPAIGDGGVQTVEWTV